MATSDPADRNEPKTVEKPDADRAEALFAAAKGRRPFEWQVLIGYGVATCYYTHSRLDGTITGQLSGVSIGWAVYLFLVAGVYLWALHWRNRRDVSEAKRLLGLKETTAVESYWSPVGQVLFLLGLLGLAMSVSV